MFPEFSDIKPQLLSAIRSQSKQLSPILYNVSNQQKRLCLNTLREAELSTVVQMTLSEHKTTGLPVFKLYFPKAFMNVYPSFPPSQRSMLGIAVAAHFLTKVPF